MGGQDPDAFLVVANNTERTIRKDEQVMFCYGRRTNYFLLLNYGFALPENRYNSLQFRLWETLSPKEKLADFASAVVPR